MTKSLIQLFKPSARSEIILATVGGLFIALGFLFQVSQGSDDPIIRVLFGLSFLIGGYHKAVEGIHSTIKDKALNVEILMILAALSAFLTGNFSEGAVLILIFSISGALESYTTQKSQKALTSLLQLAPDQATLTTDQGEKVVSVASLKVGDIVSVKVGEQVPVDGTIIKGFTTLNESSITGEAMPVEKGQNDFVYASTLNQTALILVQCDKNPLESTVQKIIDFVKSAQEDEPQIQTRINTIEKVYVYVVILLAIAFMVIPPLLGWWTQEDAFYRGIIVLVVGSPCALVASITPGVLASISHASRKKVLIKGGSKLEGMTEIECVIFDKTGTLTEGKPAVDYTFVAPEKEAYLPVFIGMEKASNHPLAIALVKAHPHVKPNEVSPEEIPGKGLELNHEGHLYQVGKFEHKLPQEMQDIRLKLSQEGSSVVTFYIDGEVVGMFGLKDQVKPEAIELVRYLKAKKIHTVMVSGDLIATAKTIHEDLHMDGFHAECLPEDKVTWIKHYQSKFKKVMMIGDGINDAPALALADVSIAMGSGTDVSLESSDIVLIDSQLKGIELTFELAKRLKRIINMNVIFSVSVIAVLLLFNTMGWVLLPIGVLVHELSTIIVILNSLRLLI
jgi:Cd2+/Zn2+-exporting ATPase